MPDHLIEAALLPGLPADLIRAAYASAPGNEIESGEFFSPESSSALAANAFGLFLARAADLPPICRRSLAAKTRVGLRNPFSLRPPFDFPGMAATIPASMCWWKPKAP